MKFYAVRKGRKTGIFRNWDECKRSVSGFKGAEYKSFPDLKSAQEYMDAPEQMNSDLDKFIDESTLIAYCDGSCPSNGSVYGAGVVMLTSDKKILRTMSSLGYQSDMLSMRNVAGEVLAAELAMTHAIRLGYFKLVIYHDYLGISKWCLDEWQANKIGTIRFKETYQQNKKQGLKVRFEKVKSHSGDPYNDLADLLAKEVIGLASHKEVLDHKLDCLLHDYVHQKSESYLYRAIDEHLLTELGSSIIHYVENHSDLKFESFMELGDRGFRLRFVEHGITEESTRYASKDVVCVNNGIRIV